MSFQDWGKIGERRVTVLRLTCILDLQVNGAPLRSQTVLSTSTHCFCMTLPTLVHLPTCQLGFPTLSQDQPAAAPPTTTKSLPHHQQGLDGRGFAEARQSLTCPTSPRQGMPPGGGERLTHPGTEPWPPPTMRLTESLPKSNKIIKSWQIWRNALEVSPRVPHP